MALYLGSSEKQRIAFMGSQLKAFMAMVSKSEDDSGSDTPEVTTAQCLYGTPAPITAVSYNGVELPDIESVDG